MNFGKGKLHIPGDFFKGINELKVLEVCHLNSELSSTLQPLVNLRTLCLNDCRLYGAISGIGSLRKLEVVSFYNSHLDHFPSEIMQLSNLKSLDLRFKKGHPLPSGMLVSLKNLEELYLGSYYQEWERKGVEAYSGVITEISSLLNLQTVQFCAYDDYCLEQVLENLHPENLTSFNILRATVGRGFNIFQFSRVLTLEDVNVDLLSKPAIQTLLCEAKHLALSVKGLTNMVNQLDVNGFVNLKKLVLYNCDLKYLVDATDRLTNGGAFIRLEELHIKYLHNLEELCYGNLPPGSFSRLRVMQLDCMNTLRHLWGAIQHSIPETLVLHNEGDEKDTRGVEFPQLEIVELCGVTNLRSFSSEPDQETLFRKVMLPNLKTLSIQNVDGIKCIVDDQVPLGSLSKLQIMHVSNCDGLRHVATSDFIKQLRSLEELSVSGATSLEVVFDFTSLNIEGANIQSLLGQLQWLELESLPNLKHIWRMLPEGIHAFKNLTSLNVQSCDNLRYLFSPSMAKMFVGLETLKLKRCDQMEAIIGRDERPILEIESEAESTKKIVFPKLRCIRMNKLPNCQILCSKNIDLELPSLTKLDIGYLPRFGLHRFFFEKELVNLETLAIRGTDGLSYLLDGQMPIGSLSKLQYIKVEGCQGLQHIIASNSIKLFQSLKTLHVRSCESLKTVFDFKDINIEGADMESLLDRLESLKLYSLHNLKLLWRMLPEGIHAFKNLTSLKVDSCHSLRYLVSPSMATMLVGLETLELRCCKQMEAIMGWDEKQILEIESEEVSVKGKDGEESTKTIVFPKLRSITIDALESFQISFSENFSKKELVNLDTLEIRDVGIICILDDQTPIGSHSKLQRIEVDECHGLQHIAASNSIKLLQSLKTLDVWNCKSLEAVFDFRGINVEGVDMESLLDRLESLTLTSLPNLKLICRMLPEGIHAIKNLTSLDVESCNNLRYLFSPSMAKMLVGLETLTLKWCKEMEAMIGWDERLISETESEEDTVKKKDGEEISYKIQFPKLRYLKLRRLKNFRMLCSENVDLEFPLLTELVIEEECPEMTKFCVGLLSAPRLYNVQVRHFRDDELVEGNVALADFISWLKDFDSKIRCLKCSFLGEETCRHLG